MRGIPQGARGEGREGAPTLPSALPNHFPFPLSTPSRAAQADLEAEVKAREDSYMELGVKTKWGLKQLKKAEAAEAAREAAEAEREAAEEERHVQVAKIQQRVEVEASLVPASFIAMLLSVLPCPCI